MTNLFSKSADFQEVKKNAEALAYHASRFEDGHRYRLALLCFAEVENNAKNT